MMMAAAKINLALVNGKRHTPSPVWVVCVAFFVLSLLAGCSPSAEAELFIPPTAAPASPTPEVTLISLNTATATGVAEAKPSETPIPELTPTPEAIASATIENCTNDLKYLSDLTVPDGEIVAPGQKIDKQWLVLNNGTCNWNEGYRLRLVGGFPPLGAEISQLLFPARAGSEVTVQIFFIAPATSGVYRSAWQAYDPEGLPFGETIYIEINVP